MFKPIFLTITWHISPSDRLMFHHHSLKPD